jgi:hypothetical protein
MEYEDLEKMADEMEVLFGNLPSPEHEPKRFKYYIRLYVYLKNKGKN